MKLRVRNPLPAISLDPWMIAIPMGVVVVGGLAYGLTTLLTDDAQALPPGVPLPAWAGAPFAAGIRRPQWPVVTNNPKLGLVSYKDVNGRFHGNWSRRFGAPRDGRLHAGVDVFANNGDPVVAMGDGVVLATQTFHLGTHAIFVDHGGIVVMYGEVDPKSWLAYGVAPGSRVKKGQQIATVGCMSWNSKCKSHMLHLETYVPGISKNLKWFRNQAAPAALRDPTLLLLQAATATFA